MARSQFAPPRKRPTLRILLLIAFGALVYLKYDDVIQSPWIQRLRHPAGLADSLLARFRSTSPETPPGSAPAVNADSTLWIWSCRSSRSDSCISTWDGLGEVEKGQLRAVLNRGLIQSGLSAADSFAANFTMGITTSGNEGEHSNGLVPDSVSNGSSIAGSRSWSLTAIRFMAQGGARTMGRYRKLDGHFEPSASGTWCMDHDPVGTSGTASTPNCLLSAEPRFPFSTAITWSLDPARPPALVLQAASGQAFHPILPGKVLEIHEGPTGWMKVHHGGLIFSRYDGFAALGPGLVEGKMVDPEDTLGFAARSAIPDSLSTSVDSAQAATVSALRLSIEKDGSPVDPAAFLGLESDSTLPSPSATPLASGDNHAR